MLKGPKFSLDDQADCPDNKALLRYVAGIGQSAEEYVDIIMHVPGCRECTKKIEQARPNHFGGTDPKQRELDEAHREMLWQSPK